jgi:protein-disulfide isomerase
VTSGKQARRRRAQPPPPVRAGSGPRKASPRVLIGAGAVLAAVVAAIVLVVALTDSSKKQSVGPLPGSAAVAQMFRGIPQRRQMLGAADAPVTVIEYIDLQCPSCRAFETDVMPEIVDRYVRTGKAKVEARPIAIIGPDSRRGARATLAAGLQNHLFDFSQILYLNQGPENSGWLNESMIQSAAASIPGLDAKALSEAQDSTEVSAIEQRVAGQAAADQVSGTPTVYVVDGRGRRVQVTPGRVPSVADMSAAIEGALP